MSRNRYTLLGYAVWHGGKWYLRKRMASARKLALGGLGTAATLTGGAMLAKRLAG